MDVLLEKQRPCRVQHYPEWVGRKALSRSSLLQELRKATSERNQGCCRSGMVLFALFAMPLMPALIQAALIFPGPAKSVLVDPSAAACKPA